MKIIPYLEISPKIMTLIESAEKELFIVSPYINIDKWEKMKDCLIRAINKNVKIWFYVRKNAEHNNYSLRYLYEIGISPIFIENLHAKLYVNERYGIVSSQNLYYFSDIKSIDIGYETENTKERAELIDFIDKAVRRDEVRQIDNNLYSTDINEIIGTDYYKNKNYSLSKPILRILYEQFKNKYSNVKFYKESGYLFSKNLFPFFIEVELDCRYMLFFKKENPIFEELTEKIRRINFDVNHKFKLNSDITSLKKFNSLDFEPCSEIDYIKLIHDFKKITDKILEALNTNTEKRQINNSNQINNVIDEQEFLELLYRRFRNKYPNIDLNKTDSILYLNYFSSFFYVVSIGFCYYQLKTQKYAPFEMLKKIIKVFENNQFKTEKYYNTFTFYFDQKIIYANIIDILEKVTDEIIEILLQYERN